MLLRAMERYFHGAVAESVESCAVALGLTGSNTGVLFKLWRVLRMCECRCMDARQSSRTLAGELEADATSIRKWKCGDGRNAYLQLFGILQRPSAHNEDRCCNLHAMSLAYAKSFGKPPPESKLRVEETNAFQQVKSKDPRGLRTLLLTDGAPCYKGLAKKYKLLLRQCNHAKGVFAVTRNAKKRGKVKVHTGGIDGFWKIVKQGIPASISSLVKGRTNKNLWAYVRSAH